MAENSNETNGGGAPKGMEADASAPGLQIVTQYVKDLSFENPGIGVTMQRPEIDFHVDLQARRAGQTEQFEVVLKMRVSALQESKTIFLLELAYAGLFLLRNIPEENLQPVLMIECPRLLFPFVRRIIADIVRDGGLPPLMIEPIDFAALYRAKMAEGATMRVSPT